MALSLYSMELLDAETGQRGYLLTGQQIYLAPYQQALASNKRKLTQARALFAGDPAQAEKLQQLASIFDSKLAELSQTIQLAQNGNRQAAMAIMRQGQGRRDMVAFQRIRQQMSDSETRLLALTLAANVVEHGRILAVTGICSVTILLIIIAAGARTVARIKGPLSGLTEGVAAVSKGDMNHRVEIRSRDEIGALAAAFNDMTDLLVAANCALTKADEMQTLLSALVFCSVDAIISKTTEGIVTSWNPAAERMFGYTDREMVGQPIALLIPLDRLEEESDILAIIRNGENLAHFETIRRRKNGENFPILITISPIKSASGSISGVSKIARDMTERDAKENQLSLMVNELNHRVKNTLTTVQAIASQSLLGADPSFCEKLEGRLLALARAHDVLTRESWEGANLEDVLAAALSPFEDQDGKRFTLNGPRLRITPNAALALAMVVHELCTNALKYGALSARQGGVGIDWKISQHAEALFCLTWTEQGGPAVKPPTTLGFGARLIAGSLARNFGGTAAVNFDQPAGVVAVLEIVLAKVVAPAESASDPRDGTRAA